MRGEGEKGIVTSLHPVCVWCHSTLARATSGRVWARNAEGGGGKQDKTYIRW